VSSGKTTGAEAALRTATDEVAALKVSFCYVPLHFTRILLTV